MNKESQFQSGRHSLNFDQWLDLVPLTCSVSSTTKFFLFSNWCCCWSHMGLEIILQSTKMWTCNIFLSHPYQEKRWMFVNTFSGVALIESGTLVDDDTLQHVRKDFLRLYHNHHEVKIEISSRHDLPKTTNALLCPVFPRSRIWLLQTQNLLMLLIFFHMLLSSFSSFVFIFCTSVNNSTFLPQKTSLVAALMQGMRWNLRSHLKQGWPTFEMQGSKLHFLDRHSRICCEEWCQFCNHSEVMLEWC